MAASACNKQRANGHNFTVKDWTVKSRSQGSSALSPGRSQHPSDHSALLHAPVGQHSQWIRFRREPACSHRRSVATLVCAPTATFIQQPAGLSCTCRMLPTARGGNTADPAQSVSNRMMCLLSSDPHQNCFIRVTVVLLIFICNKTDYLLLHQPRHRTTVLFPLSSQHSLQGILPQYDI